MRTRVTFGRTPEAEEAPMAAGHPCGQPNRLLSSEIAILILPTYPQHSQKFNEIETQDDMFTLF